MPQNSSISSYGDVKTVMDWPHFREFTLGDKDLEVEILLIFVKGMPDYIAELNACEVTDWPSACHKLKGTARMIGAWSLAYYCESAESVATPEQGSGERKQIIAHIQDELGILMEELSREYEILQS